ncbi:MAG: Inner membrane protein YdjM [Pelotomaculum sp. PtaU1.Bin065]|nr:MAG: Inner membrane protein YdjM [Pelotomaculum sp. PtaU1.Bin065]
MLSQTHFAGGLAAGAAVILYTHSPCGAVLPVLFIAALTGLVPDIDKKGSLANQLLGGVGGTVAAKMTHHRTATHSLLAAVGIYLALLVLHVPYVYLLAAMAGLLFGHLVLDMLNPHGVPLLWPLPLKVGVPLITTGHIGETFIVRPACYLLAGYFMAIYFGFIGNYKIF